MVQGWLEVIKAGIKYLTLLSKTSHVRRLRKAVDYGEQFINLFDDLVTEEDVRQKKKIRTRMRYCETKFYKLNQG